MKIETDCNTLHLKKPIHSLTLIHNLLRVLGSIVEGVHKKIQTIQYEAPSCIQAFQSEESQGPVERLRAVRG